MHNADIVSMPDKWEYPWYAAWDLAFHVIALTMVDEDFGKQQLDLMLRGDYLHPNGQLPAYEWNFGDVNPPVHAWSTIFTYRLEKLKKGVGDLDWLDRSFQKLLLNFTWWVNRKDRTRQERVRGRFPWAGQHRCVLLQLAIADRRISRTGGRHRVDGVVLSEHARDGRRAGHVPARVWRNVRQIPRTLFMDRGGDGACRRDTGMWDEEDGFFYDVLRLPDGGAQRLKVRSMVGLLPLCAATVYEGQAGTQVPRTSLKRLQRLIDCPAGTDRVYSRSAQARCVGSVAGVGAQRGQASPGYWLKMLDERVPQPYGIRAFSRYPRGPSLSLQAEGEDYRVSYLPAESDTGMFGGNSNLRGPIWMPVNGLIIRALLQYYAYYGDNFTIECPTGSGPTDDAVSGRRELTRQLTNIFLNNSRPTARVWRGTKFQDDPHLRDLILFYEYFHGDNGAGLGAPPNRLDGHHCADDASVHDKHEPAIPGIGQDGRRRHGRGAGAEWPDRGRAAQPKALTCAHRPTRRSSGATRASGR